MKRNIIIVCAILCCGMMMTACSSGFFGSMDTLREKAEGALGDGSAGNPFKVKDLAALRKVGSGTDGWTLDSHYKLTADITITGTWKPIGGEGTVYDDDDGFTVDTAFRGGFDGNGKTIALGTMGQDSYIIAIMPFPIKAYGLFGLTRDGAEVRNLKLTGKITTDPDTLSTVGAVTGVNMGGVIQNVSSRVAITCEKGVAGGIAGFTAEGAITNCYSSARLEGHGQGLLSCAGGIVGYINDGTDFTSNIRYCWTSGEIYADENAGGICGANKMASSILSNCVALTTVIFCDDGSTTHGRIAGDNDGGLDNNWANSAMAITPVITIDDAHDDINGKSVSITATQASNGAWWTGTAGWADVWGGANEDKPWKWDPINSRPILWFEAKL